MKARNRKEQRKRRHFRLRNKVAGTRLRPRMSITLSNASGFVQFIDDDEGLTLAGEAMQGDRKQSINMSSAYVLGKDSALKAKAMGIEEVVIDRGGRKFHGCVREVVRGALDGGLKAGASSISSVEADGEQNKEA